MPATTTHTLKRLAALIWAIGVIVLFTKSSSLLIQAAQINTDPLWIVIGVLTGLTVGAIKARWLFWRICLKNLKRIEGLAQPRVWQCYRPRFFLFLLLMISLGAFLSRLAQGDYAMLISLAAVEISVATALLGSILCFWRE